VLALHRSLIILKSLRSMFVFLEECDLRQNALIERKSQLRRLLSRHAKFPRPVPRPFGRHGSGLFGLVCQRDLVGIVAKLRHGITFNQLNKIWLTLVSLPVDGLRTGAFLQTFVPT
jgi:hypothetical protein